MLPHGVEHSGEEIFSYRSHNAKLSERIEHSGYLVRYKMKTNERYNLILNNSQAGVVHLLAEQSDTKSNEKLGGFRSCHTEEL